MRFALASTIALFAGAATAASTWGFSDGTLEVVSRSADAAGAGVHKFSDKEAVKAAVNLAQGDKIKVSVTTKEGSKAKRPHQAFLTLKHPSSGLEAPFPFTIKESGKATVEIAQKDLPIQLLLSQEPLSASLVLGSFGSTKGSVTTIFDVTVTLDPNQAAPTYEAPIRYGKLPEIHHIFRADPKNPPIIISLVFAGAVVATVPALIVGLGVFGANLNHLQKALGSAPVSHVTFVASVIAMEGVFFLYYSGTKLLTILPFIGATGLVAFLSGIKALGEVQRRRLGGDS